MKRCPECSNTYPDAERFCSSDGAALVPADSAPHATVQMAAPGAPEPQIECPVCGGKALPGEELCSFCGTRLGVARDPATAAVIADHLHPKLRTTQANWHW